MVEVTGLLSGSRGPFAGPTNFRRGVRSPPRSPNPLHDRGRLSLVLMSSFAVSRCAYPKFLSTPHQGSLTGCTIRLKAYRWRCLVLPTTGTKRPRPHPAGSDDWGQGLSPPKPLVLSSRCLTFQSGDRWPWLQQTEIGQSAELLKPGLLYFAGFYHRP